MMISLNLLPDIKKDLLKARRERNLAVSVSILAAGIAVGAVVILGGTLGTLTIIKNVTENSIKSSEAKIKDAQDKRELNKYLTVQNQLAQIGDLKGQQQIYSRLLGYLTNLNPAAPNNVTLQTVTLSDAENRSGAAAKLDDSGTALVMEGTASSFKALETYQNTLQNALLTYQDKSDDSSTDSQSDSTSDTSNSSTSSTSTTSTSTSTASSNSTTKLADSSSDQCKKGEKLFKAVGSPDSSLSSSGATSQVKFTIAVVLNDNAFSPNVTNTTLCVPNLVTSDGDRNAPETFHTDENDQKAKEGN